MLILDLHKFSLSKCATVTKLSPARGDKLRHVIYSAQCNNYYELLHDELNSFKS